jgi:hypothetical protein
MAEAENGQVVCLCSSPLGKGAMTRIGIARGIAIGADVLQIGLFPFFAEGWVSPLDIAVDTVMCAVLTWLVGWHISFLPSFIVKGVPMVDLAPTWTIAVLIATRKKAPPIIKANQSGSMDHQTVLLTTEKHEK